MSATTLQLVRFIAHLASGKNMRHHRFLCIASRPPQGGSIVFVSSITAFGPGAPLGMYAVSKTALVGLTKALAQELAPRGIRVNCIAPGEHTTRAGRDS